MDIPTRNQISSRCPALPHRRPTRRPPCHRRHNVPPATIVRQLPPRQPRSPPQPPIPGSPRHALPGLPPGRPASRQEGHRMTPEIRPEAQVAPATPNEGARVAGRAATLASSWPGRKTELCETGTDPVNESETSVDTEITNSVNSFSADGGACSGPGLDGERPGPVGLGGAGYPAGWACGGLDGMPGGVSTGSTGTARVGASR